jgi:hypothetical protein
MARRVAAVVAAALIIGTLLFALTRNVGVTVTPTSATPQTVLLHR